MNGTFHVSWVNLVAVLASILTCALVTVLYWDIQDMHLTLSVVVSLPEPQFCHPVST